MDIAPINFAEPKLRGDGVTEVCAESAEDGFASGLAFAPAERVLPGALGGELWLKAGAEAMEVTEAEFAEALEAIGKENNFGLDPEIASNGRERETFWRALHLEELAIARGCALGREAAWQRFLAAYREPLTRAAVAMTGQSAAGEELADALYSELFGLTERDGKRWSPLVRYSGRGSLMGWLRAVLAQRRVNQYRKTVRETALDEMEPAAAESFDFAWPEIEQLDHLRLALASVLSKLDPEDRFLVSAHYLDRRTLLEMSSVLKVHEATVSRKLKRTTERLRKELLRALMARGLGRRAAGEALGTDPRDVDVNLRKLLQDPGSGAISGKEGRV